MEFVLNWMVMLLTLGGIALIAFVCYADLTRRGSRAADSAGDFPEYAGVSDVVSAPPVGPYIELCYRRDGAIEHVQTIRAGQRGYIGTESYEVLGAGMPVRYVEIAWEQGCFNACNLDCDLPVSVRDSDGAEIGLAYDQSVTIEDGSTICLDGGWTIDCRVMEAAEQ